MSRGPDHRSVAARAWRALYKRPEWRALRAEVLAAEPFCGRVIHGKRLIPTTVVNHRIPHKGDETLFFDRGNLQAVCKPCHDGAIQRAERRGFKPDVDAAGYPIDPAHPSNQPTHP